MQLHVIGVASSHRVGGFQQIVAEIAVAGFDELGVLGLEVAGLVLDPDKAGILGNRSLGIEAADIADLGNDTGGVDFADAGDGGERVRDDLELLLNRLVQNFDLPIQRPHRGNVLVLGHAGALEEQVIGKVLFLPRQVLYNVKSGSGER